MLKFLFWSLIAINGALFAYSQGYLGNTRTNEREPARLKAQLNPEKLTLVSSAQVQAAANAAANKPPEIVPCTEVGSFTAPLAKRFEALVGELELGERQSRSNTTGGEGATHIVAIPSQGSKEAAEKKAGELKRLGVTNYVILGEESSMKWGISLGVFKNEQGAKDLLATLQKQGVHSARITSRGGAPGGKVVYRFKDIDRATRARLELIKADFPGQEIHDCKTGN